MKAQKNLKKRKLEQSPPPSQKKIKNEQKEENSQLVAIPVIEKITNESSGKLTITSFEEKQMPSFENLPIIEKPPIESENPQFTIINLDTGEPILILPDFSDLKNEAFILKPENENQYEHLRQMSAKPYEFKFDRSQWISTRVIRYHELDRCRFFSINEQIYLQKSQDKKEKKKGDSLKYNLEELKEKKEKKTIDSLEGFLENITYQHFNETYSFKGPSGIGKSHKLIEWVLQYRKNENYRILHIILDDCYMTRPIWNFLFDFFYCFRYDLNAPDFPQPPKIDNFIYIDKLDNGENWFRFLSKVKLINDSFLDGISEYLKSKKIAFILIFDQDNIYQRISQKKNLPFFTSLRESSFFNCIVISASNNNECFDISLAHQSYEINLGFSIEKTNEFLTNILEKLIGCRLKINNQFLEHIYKITNGNGYLLSKFLRSKGQTLEKKLKNFKEEIIQISKVPLTKFFIEKMNHQLKLWKREFPLIIRYLDTDVEVPSNHYSIVDKNFSYIEDSKLRSVNPIAKEIYLEYYEEQVREFNLTENYLCLLLEEINKEKSNSVLKGILYERYVIMKFQEYIKDKKDIVFKYTLNNGGNEKFNCKISKLLIAFSDDEINDEIQTYNGGCIIKPIKFSHPVFDMIVWDGERQFLYVLQITINLSHSAVDRTFFTDKKYSFLLKHKNVKEIRFLWVTDQSKFEPKYTEARIGCLILRTKFDN